MQDRPKRPPPSHVYIIASEVDIYKIGVTSNIKRRMYDLDCGSPYALTLVALAESEDAYAAERELHARYGRRRVSGEWFELDDAEVYDICEYLGVPAPRRYSIAWVNRHLRGGPPGYRRHKSLVRSFPRGVRGMATPRGAADELPDFMGILRAKAREMASAGETTQSIARALGIGLRQVRDFTTEQ